MNNERRSKNSVAQDRVPAEPGVAGCESLPLDTTESGSAPRHAVPAKQVTNPAVVHPSALSAMDSAPGSEPGGSGFESRRAGHLQDAPRVKRNTFKVGQIEVVYASFAACIEREVNALQAKIDALMLEHCPDEMSEEQIARWAAHQVAACIECDLIGKTACPEHGGK